MVIAGEEDQAAGAVSFRFRNGEQQNGIPVADAIEYIKNIVAQRTQV
jgi:threonyl-tRNA synthetase